MRRLIVLVLAVGTALKGYGQCDADRLFFVDEDRNLIDSSVAISPYILNEGRDTLFLEALYDLDFSRVRGFVDYQETPIHSFATDTIRDAKEPKRSKSIYYCATCEIGDVKMIDSIDLNKDGVKEVIILREWYCFVTPSNMGPVGVGGQQQYYSRYEIWDVKAKQQLVEINSSQEASVAITTNVMQDFGYRFEVKINKDGSFLLSNLHGEGSALEMGTYEFDVVAGQYIRIDS